MSDYVLIQAQIESYVDQIAKEEGDRPLSQAILFLSALMDHHGLEKEEDFKNFFELMFSKYKNNSKKEFIFDFLLKNVCTFHLTKNEGKALFIYPFITKAEHIGSTFDRTTFEKNLKDLGLLNTLSNLTLYTKILPFLTGPSIWSYFKTRKVFESFINNKDLDSLFSSDLEAYKEFPGSSAIACIIGIVSYDTKNIESPFTTEASQESEIFEKLQDLSKLTSSNCITPFIPLMSTCEFELSVEFTNKVVREMLFQQELSELLKARALSGQDVYVSNKITEIIDPANGLELEFLSKTDLKPIFSFKVFATSKENLSALKKFVDQQFSTYQIEWLDHRLISSPEEPISNKNLN